MVGETVIGQRQREEIQWLVSAMLGETVIGQRQCEEMQWLVRTNLWPFLSEHIKEFVLDVTLNDNLIVSCDRAAARKTTSKELARDLQINIYQHPQSQHTTFYTRDSEMNTFNSRSAKSSASAKKHEKMKAHEVKVKQFSSSWQVISELRGVTCHMGPHTHTVLPATRHKWTRRA